MILTRWSFSVLIAMKKIDLVTSRPLFKGLQRNADELNLPTFRHQTPIEKKQTDLKFGFMEVCNLWIECVSPLPKLDELVLYKQELI